MKVIVIGRVPPCGAISSLGFGHAFVIVAFSGDAIVGE
jgi:hypothetical protein